MKIRHRLNSANLAYTFGGVLLSGSIVSAMLTTDKRWMNWHFSRLGEGGTFSSVIFNTTMLIAAIIMFTLGLSLIDGISKLPESTNVDINRAKIILKRDFNAVTVCMVGVAIFPFDRFPAIHNICGYSMLFIFMGLCLTMQKILPIFPKKFYTFSKIIVICAIICYTLFLILQVVTLLTVEFIMFSFLYIWLLMFIKGIRENYSLE